MSNHWVVLYWEELTLGQVPHTVGLFATHREAAEYRYERVRKDRQKGLNPFSLITLLAPPVPVVVPQATMPN